MTSMPRRTASSTASQLVMPQSTVTSTLAGPKVSSAFWSDSGVKPYPSDANYVLFRLENAGIIWEMLYGRGVLVRDFSRAPGLEDCLRVSIGSREENDAFLRALRDAVMGKCDLEVPSA